MSPELDIVVYAVDATTSSASGEHTRRVFRETARRNLHLAMIELPVELARPNLDGMHIDSPTLTCLRSVLIKPEQSGWTDRIAELLEASAKGTD